MTDLRLGTPADRGPPLRFRFAGRMVEAFEGETVATALLAAGIRVLRRDPEPRGMLCAMGVCQDCVVVIDGRRREACRTPAADGLVVEPAA